MNRWALETNETCDSINLDEDRLLNIDANIIQIQHQEQMNPRQRRLNNHIQQNRSSEYGERNRIQFSHQSFSQMEESEDSLNFSRRIESVIEDFEEMGSLFSKEKQKNQERLSQEIQNMQKKKQGPQKSSKQKIKNQRKKTSFPKKLHFQPNIKSGSGLKNLPISAIKPKSEKSSFISSEKKKMQESLQLDKSKQKRFQLSEQEIKEKNQEQFLIEEKRKLMQTGKQTFQQLFHKIITLRDDYRKRKAKREASNKKYAQKRKQLAKKRDEIKKIDKELKTLKETKRVLKYQTEEEMKRIGSIGEREQRLKITIQKISNLIKEEYLEEEFDHRF